MPTYISFQQEDNTPPLLIEIAPVPQSKPQGGTVKASTGVQKIVDTVIIGATLTLEAALSHVIGINAQAFLGALESLPNKPTEAEMSFSIKATGEAGNNFFGLAKLSGEAAYTVKLVWKEQEATHNVP